MMITKEEYQKTLIRMWDSVRKNDDDKGSPICYGVVCGNCPINSLCGKAINYYDIVEFVEKWGKEHPIETNGTKFLKTFPDAIVYDYDCDNKYVHISSIDDNSSGSVKIPRTWWNSEAEE